MTELHAQAGIVTSETLTLMTVLRVVQTMPMAVLENLELTVMVILCAADPVRQDLRKQSIQSVLMISQGLSQQFPIVDFDSKSMWLAVGHHPTDVGLSGGGGERELVSIYDLNSSAKVRILRAWEEGQGLDARDAAAAIKFSPDMDSLAAFFEAGRCIQIWSLKESWQQRLSRQTSTMAPVKMLFVDIQGELSVRPRTSSSPQTGAQKRHFTSVRKLPFALQWLASTQIELLHYGERLTIITF